jgi:hypothetical protein
VSAKTGEKVYDAIKDFGITIAKAKLEKMGMSWSSGAPQPALTPAPITSTNSSAAEKKEQPKPKEQQSEPKESSSKPSSQSNTMQLKTGKKGAPSYQKKCC